MKIINFGSLNLDEIYKVEHICASGETLRVLEFQHSIGGKGLNQSIASARAGAAVLHAGKIGKEGVCLQSFLAENGVDVSMIRLCGEPQGRAIIQLTPQADNCIFVYGGSNRAVDIPFIDDCLSHAQPGDWLMTQNEISNLPYLLNAAARRKMHIFLNASPVDAELARMDLSCVDWITVNETECCQLTGCPDTRKAYETLRGTGLVPCSFCHFILACSSTYWRTARQRRRRRHGKIFYKFSSKNAEQSSAMLRLINKASIGSAQKMLMVMW